MKKLFLLLVSMCVLITSCGKENMGESNSGNNVENNEGSNTTPDEPEISADRIITYEALNDREIEFKSWADITSHTYENGIGEIVFAETVTKIGYYAFEWCSIVRCTLPNTVAAIEAGAFRDCQYLEYINIPNSVKSIKEWAFYRCVMPSITLSNNLEVIGAHAFNECRSLLEITIPNSVTSIETNAFKDCNLLEKVIIGNNVKTIGDEAFRDCAIKSITLPNSVQSIGDRAFEGCWDLQQVYCKRTTPPTVSSEYGRVLGLFRDTHRDIKIYVPRNSVDTYKTDTHWKEYASIIVGYDF